MELSATEALVELIRILKSADVHRATVPLGDAIVSIEFFPPAPEPVPMVPPARAGTINGDPKSPAEESPLPTGYSSLFPKGAPTLRRPTPRGE